MCLKLVLVSAGEFHRGKVESSGCCMHVPTTIHAATQHNAKSHDADSLSLIILHALHCPRLNLLVWLTDMHMVKAILHAYVNLRCRFMVHCFIAV